MNKIYLSAVALFLTGNVAMAQFTEGRTSQTIIADVAGQMPAKNVKAYDKLMKDLASTGEEGVLALVKMINPPGDKSNAKVDYALHNLSYYVMGLKDEAKRLTLAKAYVKALDAVDEREAKAFILRQIQLVGKDECIEPLGIYLSNPELSGPTARALSAIGSEKANQMLIASLRRRMGNVQTQIDAVEAIAEIKRSGAEELLLAILQTQDQNLKKAVVYALGEVGTKASLKQLSTAAETVGYAMEKTGVNEAYIALIKRILAEGDEKTALSEAKKLFKKADKAGAVHSKIAAADIMMDIYVNEKAIDFVLKAMKDECKKYRNAVLMLASDCADAEMYIELIKRIDKKQTAANVDVLNWLGRESQTAKKFETLKNLEIRFDRTAYQVMVEQIQKGDFAVKQAAVWALVKLKQTAFIPDLASMLASEDEQIVLMAQDALYAFSGDINAHVASVLNRATDKGKICGLELLGNRKADAQLNAVLKQIKTGSQAVKKTAYAVLRDVVSPKDFIQLCGMIETCETPYVAPMQDAVTVSLKDKSSKEQVATILRRMMQAGESKKHVYYKVLATTNEAEALEMIVKGFNASNGEAKNMAFEALLTWNGIEVADELYSIAKTTPDYLDKALTAYVKLVSNRSFTGENRLLLLRKAMEIAKSDVQKSLILKQIGNTDTYLGMLYAYEFINDAGTKQAAAMAVKSIALRNTNYTGDNVREMLEKVLITLNHEDARYDRDAIKKHLSEMPDCNGFVSMFNGTDLTGWKGLVQNPIARSKMSKAELAKAQKVADEEMHNGWSVENGVLVFKGKGNNICTEKQYADFEMYVDWMLDPAGPEADAGIYLRGTPQVQIWDTARVNVGAQVGSGGLYNNSKGNISNPLKVADNKLGEWNTFYIKMQGDRVTVYLNGELVTDNVMMDNYWDRKTPIFPMEQIELQAHGCKVSYRNLYIKELKRSEPFSLSAEEKKEGFELLFDGTNMHAWQGNIVDYALEGGVISLTPSKSFGGNLYTKKEYEDFVFRFEFQLTPGANNGLGIRTPMGKDAAYYGMELQILDNTAPIYKNLKKTQYHGSVYGIIAAKRGALKPVGEWNVQEVVAKGDHIKVILNGQVIVDGNIREATKNGTYDGREHPGLFNKKGYIGFLGHGNPLKFRNIRVKEL